MCFLSAPRTKSYQILGCVIAEVAPRLNVMYLKAIDANQEQALQNKTFANNSEARQRLQLYREKKAYRGE